MATATDPTIPLVAAEYLHVALQIAKQSTHLDDRAKSNIGVIIAMYEVKRDEHLLNNGLTQRDIHKIQTAVANELADWLEDKAKAAEQDDELEELEKYFHAEEAEADHPTSPQADR